MADMLKNQLQELAQRSCFNLPSYACIREGPDHAPRFKAYVNFNGEIFESPSYCPTLRQAEHSAAEAALNILSIGGPSRSLTARLLDETGVYKNLLQESAHRAGLKLPVYTTVRSGPGHLPIFTCTVELAGMNFTGEPAKTKKQAEKNAAIAAWSALKTMSNMDSLTKKEGESHEERDQAVVSRVLSSFKSKDDIKQFRRSDIISLPRSSGKSLVHQKWMLQRSLLSPPPPRSSASKILPQIRGKSKDEDEWSGAKECSSSRNLVSNSNVQHNMLDSATSELISRILGSRNPSQMARNMHAGCAPAVKMRSVIPVCAAPPNRPHEQNIGGSSSSQSMQIGATQADVSSSVMFNKSSQTHLDSDQLSSELKNLELSK